MARYPQLGGGFTLIECLVVVALIATLVAISLPAISSVKRESKRVLCLSQVAGAAQLIVNYALDHRDAYPYPLSADRGSSSRLAIDGRQEVNVPDILDPARHGLIAGYWHYSLLGSFGGPARPRSLVCPADRESLEHVAANPQAVATIIYSMSMAMFHHPRALDPNNPRLDDRSLWVGQTQRDVLTPARKALLYEPPMHESWFRSRGLLKPPPYRQTVAAADGHVEWRSTAHSIPEIPFVPDRAGLRQPPPSFYGRTPRGVHGSDW